MSGVRTYYVREGRGVARAKPNEMLAAERRKLRRLFAALMERFGAVRVNEGEDLDPWAAPSYRLETCVGALTLTAASRLVNEAAIYGRFAEPRRAAAFFNPELPLPTGPLQGFGFRVNPYSGKWNHHWGRVTAAEALHGLELGLIRLIDSEANLR